MNDDILHIISAESGVRVNQIRNTDTLLVDLKIDGDDAWELFEQCHVQFGLDLTDYSGLIPLDTSI